MANVKPMTNKQKLVAECKALGVDPKGLTAQELEDARDEKLVAKAEEEHEAKKAAAAAENASADDPPPAAALSRSGNYVTKCNLRSAEGVIPPGESIKLTRKEAAGYIRQGAIEPA